MESQNAQVLEVARRWAAAGHRFVLVTVAKTWGSAPRSPGAWMILRYDGQARGCVSGGCIKTDLIERVASEEFRAETPFLLRYGVSREDAHRHGLPCGGSMELVVEPAPDTASLEALAERISRGELVRRTVSVGRKGSDIHPASSADRFSWDGDTLACVYGPVWRLLLIGAGQISSCLAEMAQALDYRVFVCDPRSEYTKEWNLPQTSLITCMPDDAVMELNPDPHCAVVALTHDPKLDDMALLDALKSPAFYVGALGSRANNQRRRERLLHEFDLSPGQVDRLHGPVGLPIGSRTPPEIAVAILAEMTAVRNGTWTPQGLRTREPAAEIGCGPA
ncbi:MAG: XdhC family protein [Candidatus Thiodiazotropha sp.]